MDPPVTLAVTVDTATRESGRLDKPEAIATPCLETTRGEDKRPVTGQSQRLRDDGEG